MRTAVVSQSLIAGWRGWMYLAYDKEVGPHRYPLTEAVTSSYNNTPSTTFVTRRRATFGRGGR